MSQEKLELCPETGLIPTFAFNVDLGTAIMWLLVMAEVLEWAILSFKHMLSFR